MKAEKIRHAIHQVWPQASIWLGDEEYICPTALEVQAHLEQSKLDLLTYRPDAFDCNRFAQLAAAEMVKRSYDQDWPYPWALGVVWGQLTIGPHAMVLFVDGDMNVWIAEPQTDEIRKPCDTDSAWVVMF